MEYSYKFRLYPTKKQKVSIAKTIGCCRWIYNYAFDERNSVYKLENKILNYYDQSKELPALKEEYPWLKEVDSTALQSSLKNLDTAFKRFFKKESKFPKFKKKRDARQSYTSRMGIKIVDDKYIQLPKLGKVRCKFSKKVIGKILSATVTQTSNGKYFVSLCCRVDDLPHYPKNNKSVGIDLGVKDMFVTSDGAAYLNHKYLSKSEKKLARAQRRLSRKQKDSNNYGKAVRKVARIHEKVRNQRQDTIHKYTTELVYNYDTICIEDLATANMVKNHKLAKGISDASFGEIKRQLQYKCNWFGRELIIVDRFYPSSQLCSECGHQNPDVKNLKVRRWICPNCGSVLSRDFNAAKNILKEGLRLQALNTTGTAGHAETLVA